MENGEYKLDTRYARTLESDNYSVVSLFYHAYNLTKHWHQPWDFTNEPLSRYVE